MNVKFEEIFVLFLRRTNLRCRPVDRNEGINSDKNL